MLKTPEIRNKSEKITLSMNHINMSCKLNTEDIFSNIQSEVIMDPIDYSRISKPSNGLTKTSAVKAILVFVSTIGLYSLFKNTKILSHFGFGGKDVNSKNMDGNKIVEVKSRENVLTKRKNLKTEKQFKNLFVNRNEKFHQDSNSRK
jgi:hypothetical protein